MAAPRQTQTMNRQPAAHTGLALPTTNQTPSRQPAQSYATQTQTYANPRSAAGSGSNTPIQQWSTQQAPSTDPHSQAGNYASTSYAQQPNYANYNTPTPTARTQYQTPHNPQAAYTQNYAQGYYPGYAQPHPPFAPSGLRNQVQPLPVSSVATHTKVVDNSDPALLSDALGIAGVDLRAEEEALHRQHAPQSQAANQIREDRSRKQSSIDPAYLTPAVRAYALKQNVHDVSEDAVSYLALSLHNRLKGLVESSVKASRHRHESGYQRPPGLYADGTPMWSEIVRHDIPKQLSAIEKAEKEEDFQERQDRRSRQDKETKEEQERQALAEQGLKEGAKKKKKEGPGVQAKNMGEEARRREANLVAMAAAGNTKKYSWMVDKNGTATEFASPTPRPPAPVAPRVAAPTNGFQRPTYQPGMSFASTSLAGKKRPRPEETEAEVDERTKLELEDLLFVVRRERGHGAGRGSARGWT